MWWGYHGAGFCTIGFFLFVLIAGFIVVRFFTLHNDDRCHRRWSDDAGAILRRRLANGEIDESEYQRLNDILRK